MLARSCLTLLLCCTSTLAAAREPALRAEGPMPPRLAARRTVEPPPESSAPRPGPDLTPPTMKRDWETEHKWLQGGTGVTWALTGLGTIGMIVPLSMLSRCNAADASGADIDCTGERRTAAITTPIFAIFTLAALVPAIMFTRRLVRHKDQRPVARLLPAPGGLTLQF